MIDNHQLRNYVKAMSHPRKSLPYSLLLAVILLVALISPGAAADANHGNPGQPLDVKSLVVRGKTTVIDFYSPFCPPCLYLAPRLARLADMRPGLAVQKVNINRPGVNGIDWRSPLAQQYQLRSVPHFMIFNTQGQLVAQGREAFETVRRWLQEAGLLK
jgi:thiol-disulfide isomerase/thioredoxin